MLVLLGMKHFAHALVAAGLTICACSSSSDPPGAGVPDAGRRPPTIDAAAANAGDAAAPDAPPSGPVEPPPDSDDLFLTAPPGPDCSPDLAATWEPIGGFSGGISGRDTCGPRSPDCPTSYVSGNTGAPCSSAADCTGLAPVCLDGPKYPGGACSATGCELGSNFGCPEGDTCINGGDGQTYCAGGCGLDRSGCFVHCERGEYACFTTESKSLGMCLGIVGVKQCDPSASNRCTRPELGDGICVQTSWDDQSVGRCFETCDPLVQDCSRDGEGCYVLREYSGFPVCFQSWGFPEGTRCSRMTQCAEGLRCACDSADAADCSSGASHMFCRRYCPTDGSTPCPAGTTCRAVADGSRFGSCQP